MATTCQTVIDRAKAFNPLNTSLAPDPAELLTRIQQMQQRVYTAVASLPAALLGRSRFTLAQTINSTNAAASRVVNLASVSTPMERLLRVTLPAGTEVRPVLEFDVFAQLAPRYVVRGQSLIEVSNDWSSSSGVVAITLLYASGAAAITVAGATSQAISLPDEWADLLIKPLAMYFHAKDPGRDPLEYQNLAAEYAADWNGFLNYVTNYAGLADLRAVLPAPPEARR